MVVYQTKHHWSVSILIYLEVKNEAQIEYIVSCIYIWVSILIYLEVKNEGGLLNTEAANK